MRSAASIRCCGIRRLPLPSSGGQREAGAEQRARPSPSLPPLCPCAGRRSNPLLPPLLSSLRQRPARGAQRAQACGRGLLPVLGLDGGADRRGAARGHGTGGERAARSRRGCGGEQAPEMGVASLVAGGGPRRGEPGPVEAADIDGVGRENLRSPDFPSLLEKGKFWVRTLSLCMTQRCWIWVLIVGDSLRVCLVIKVSPG